MTTKTRSLRLAPRHIMTGDLLQCRTDDGAIWDVVTGIAPQGSGWLIKTVRFPTYYAASQTRHTVRRNGPTGLGE